MTRYPTALLLIALGLAACSSSISVGRIAPNYPDRIESPTAVTSLFCGSYTTPDDIEYVPSYINMVPNTRPVLLDWNGPSAADESTTLDAAPTYYDGLCLEALERRIADVNPQMRFDTLAVIRWRTKYRILTASTTQTRIVPDPFGPSVTRTALRALALFEYPPGYFECRFECVESSLATEAWEIGGDGLIIQENPIGRLGQFRAYVIRERCGQTSNRPCSLPALKEIWNPRPPRF